MPDLTIRLLLPVTTPVGALTTQRPRSPPTQPEPSLVVHLLPGTASTRTQEARHSRGCPAGLCGVMSMPAVQSRFPCLLAVVAFIWLVGSRCPCSPPLARPWGFCAQA